MDFWMKWTAALVLSIGMTFAANEVGYREYRKEKKTLEQAYARVSTGLMKRAVFYPDENGGILLERGDEVELVNVNYKKYSVPRPGKPHDLISVEDRRHITGIGVKVRKFRGYNAILNPSLVTFPYRETDIRGAVYPGSDFFPKLCKNVFILFHIFYKQPDFEDLRLRIIKHRDMNKGYSEFTPFLTKVLFDRKDDFDMFDVLDVIFSIGDANAVPDLVKFARQNGGSESIAEYIRQFTTTPEYLMYLDKKYSGDKFYRELLSMVGGEKAVTFFLQKYHEEPDSSMSYLGAAAQTPKQNAMVYSFLRQYVSSSKDGCDKLRQHIRNLEAFAERLELPKYRIVHPCK